MWKSSSGEEMCAVCGKPIRKGIGRYRLVGDEVRYVHVECNGDVAREGLPGPRT